jgi:hypothetical protein
MASETGWYEKRVKDWDDFTKLLCEITTRHEGEKHHFFYRGQVDDKWRLEPSLFREPIAIFRWVRLLQAQANTQPGSLSSNGRHRHVWPAPGAGAPSGALPFENRYKKKKEDLQRTFEIERDAKNEFASQVHLHMDPSALPASDDWLEW